MRSLIKYIVTKTYKPLLVKYLAATRHYSYKGISLDVPPQVFHPGFFFSTRFLLRHLDTLSLKNKTFLELGAGSGLIAMYAARQKALVTATDINTTAIYWLQKNSQRNRTDLEVIHSDLFENIPPQAFDFIAINPPYYKKKPVLEIDHAWYCGEQGEYFSRLFAGLGSYRHRETKVLMVLSDACDLEMISAMARDRGFTMDLVQQRKNLLETNFIFRILMIK